MIRPPTRTKFLNADDELNYLSNVIRYYSNRGQLHAKQAATFLLRFGELLNAAGLDNGSIMLQYHWALYHETIGNIPQAIVHRVKEIELIEYLLRLGGPVGPINNSFLVQSMQSLFNNYQLQGESAKGDQLLKRIMEIKNNSLK